jgi:hypothetical protein
MKLLLASLFAIMTFNAIAQSDNKTAAPSDSSKAQPSHYWYDGATKRPLYISTTQAADFSPTGKSHAHAKNVLVPAQGVSGSVEGKVISPVFSDQPAGHASRALPGGVIVTFKTAISEADARAKLVAAGLTPVRYLGSDTHVWLIQSPAGTASLDLANSLFESGEFEAAQPNWWQPRALK